MCFRTRVRLPPSPPSKIPLPSPGRGILVCALRARSRTGRRTAVREKQSGGLFFSPRVLPPSPPVESLDAQFAFGAFLFIRLAARAYSRHLFCERFYFAASVISLLATFFAKVTSRPFCCAPFSPQNLAVRFFAGGALFVCRSRDAHFV